MDDGHRYPPPDDGHRYPPADDGHHYAPTEIIRSEDLQLTGLIPQGYDPGRPQQPQGSPPRRGIWILACVAVAVPVAAVLAVTALLPDSPTEPKSKPTAVVKSTEEPGAADSAGKTTAAATTQEQSAGLDNLEQVDGGRATSLAGEAGADLGDRVDDAWTWTDANGLNLLATGTVDGDGRGRGGRRDEVELRVTHLAGLDGDARKLRVMHDPVRCRRGELNAGFTPESIKISDLDGDGIGEATVGWWFTCEGGDRPVTAKLAVLSGGDKYILRGSGRVGQGGGGQVSFAPEPKPAAWPDPLYGTATELFGKLYS